MCVTEDCVCAHVHECMHDRRQYVCMLKTVCVHACVTEDSVCVCTRACVRGLCARVYVTEDSVCLSACVTEDNVCAHTCVAEDNLRKSASSFQHVRPEDKIWVIRLDSESHFCEGIPAVQNRPFS